jgi:hypothetical protein
MYQKKEITLAETIIFLDLLRDQLYEQLMDSLGAQAHELLRSVQND